jgi:aminoglycoside phosphotransferase (APT) family kinase protein
VVAGKSDSGVVNEAERWLTVIAEARVAGEDSRTAGGVTVQRVRGGFNNALYRVESGRQRYACKLCVTDERRRAAREYNALRTLEAAGLNVAPRPLCLDESCTILSFPVVVYRWVPGEPLSPNPTEEQLVALLDNFHQVQTLRPPEPGVPDAWFHWFSLDPYLDEMRTFPACYGPWLKGAFPDGEGLNQRMDCLIDHCAKVFSTTKVDPSRERVPLRLCRVDVNLQNAIWGENRQLRWVDWEFSGWGDPAFELAELRWHAALEGLTDHQHAWLRENYQRPAGDTAFEARLAVWDCLVVTRWCLLILRALWSAHSGPDRLRLTRPNLDPAELHGRLVRFVERAERHFRS